MRIEADEKTTESERLAALEIKENIWRFKFKDAVKIKSDGARIHFGVGAQTVGNILRKYGLDPNNYAFWCYDEWDDIYAPEVLIRSVKTMKQESGTTRNIAQEGRLLLNLLAISMVSDTRNF